MIDRRDRTGPEDVGSEVVPGEGRTSEHDPEIPTWAQVDWDRLGESRAVGVHDPNSATPALEISPARSDRILSLMSLPSFAPSEAEARADRAEEEARVLRRELERERAERSRLEQLLAQRHVFRPRREGRSETR